ncbi:hypothetical protein K2173_016801 [Erythroxylum novogranatense]|uniref:Protein LURP-one-related 7 n=1 Tax=Erythroxylum novogranatense TaxID=1862640 RepID=A0AAV8SHS5_9ROSI|nr:hypothetical protein K2173_016801 [Erythroxylum novogranatense]
MASSDSGHQSPPNSVSPIPVDLFVSKKHPGLSRGELGFADSSGNILFRASSVASSPKTRSSRRNKKRIVLDASGNPIFSIYPQENGSWQAFKWADGGDKDLVFRVQRTLNNFTRTELEVFLVGETAEEPVADFKVIGFPFQRSCTIYRGDSILAQTSLMYKLHQIFVGRSKFRLTIFPASVDTRLIVALTVIFLNS